LNVQELVSDVSGRPGDSDVRLCLGGMTATVGVRCEEDGRSCCIELDLPLVEEGAELDLAFLERRTGVLKQLQGEGYDLIGGCGSVKCFKEGPLEDLAGDLERVQELLAQ